MFLVNDIKLTNVAVDIKETYYRNKDRCQSKVSGGDQQVNKLVDDFWTGNNIVLRLCLAKDVINKSKAKANVTPLTFYINTME